MQFCHRLKNWFECLSLSFDHKNGCNWCIHFQQIFETGLQHCSPRGKMGFWQVFNRQTFQFFHGKSGRPATRSWYLALQLLKTLIKIRMLILIVGMLIFGTLAIGALICIIGVLVRFIMSFFFSPFPETPVAVSDIAAFRMNVSFAFFVTIFFFDAWTGPAARTCEALNSPIGSSDMAVALHWA